ncbi:MAG: hypothetical protein AVDCRST_MAG35-2059 [uncultured Quadrisphaera sp.]|uniref:DUF485 domain-containing protein n=1 Tax=uncultured Quadrisphaera sp. TaxID=904978 RepID=A0A6J4PPL9_9ACTN|nr:MAG: hypothetical protein AVDCRST_MAG35-2059 [uncultured Quadrisphaera sp.]
MSIAGPQHTEGSPPTVAQVHASEEFAGLRRVFRRTIFPATAAFLLWYATYVLLAAFAPDFMSTRVVGNITVGLLLGLGQFVTTFAITMGYRRWADRTLDTTAGSLRARLEGGA